MNLRSVKERWRQAKALDRGGGEGNCGLNLGLQQYNHTRDVAGQ